MNNDILTMFFELQVDPLSMTFDPTPRMGKCDATDVEGPVYECEALNSDGEVEFFELSIPTFLGWFRSDEQAA